MKFKIQFYNSRQPSLLISVYKFQEQQTTNTFLKMFECVKSVNIIPVAKQLIEIVILKTYKILFYKRQVENIFLLSI